MQKNCINILVFFHFFLFKIILQTQNMDNSLESMVLLEIERLESKCCRACSLELITENDFVTLEHSCYLHNKETVNKYRYAKIAVYNLKYMDLINDEEFHELENWLKSINFVEENILYGQEYCECCGWF